MSTMWKRKIDNYYGIIYPMRTLDFESEKDLLRIKLIQDIIKETSLSKRLEIVRAFEKERGEQMWIVRELKKESGEQTWLLMPFK